MLALVMIGDLKHVHQNPHGEEGSGEHGSGHFGSVSHELFLS